MATLESINLLEDTCATAVPDDQFEGYDGRHPSTGTRNPVRKGFWAVTRFDMCGRSAETT